MSRIGAIFYRDDRPVEKFELHRMMAPVRRASRAGSTWTNGTAGLAYQCTREVPAFDDVQPRVNTSGCAVVFDGRLDNREEIAADLGWDRRPALADTSDAELVLACYVRFAETFASRLKGDFSVAIFDARERRLILARDCMGIRPLYFWESRNLFLAASEIKCILQHPAVEARPDEITIADVLVGGDPNELRRTFFANVRRVIPGQTVVVTTTGIREFSHWDFDVSHQLRLSSREEYAEALRDLFARAVRHRLRSPGKVAVTVSGGLDSSAILSQALSLREGNRALAPSIGISMVFPEGTSADEKRYLEDIENRYAVEIHRLPFSSFHYMSEEKWLELIEYPRVYWNSEFVIYDTARRLGCTTLLDGYHGDQMMASNAHLFELARQFRWHRAWREHRVLGQWMTDSSPSTIRRGLVYEFLRDLAPDWLMRHYRRVRRRPDSEMYPRWYTPKLRQLAYRRCQQQRRPKLPFASKQAEISYRYFVAPHRLDIIEQVNKIAASYGVDKAYPFMDRDLVAFVISVPNHVMNWGGVFKGLFREAMRDILPENIRSRNWKAGFTALNSGAAESGYALFESLLQPDCLAARYGYMDPASVQRSIHQHRSKLSDQIMQPTVQVNSAVGLELWLRAFFHGNGASAEATGNDYRCALSGR